MTGIKTWPGCNAKLVSADDRIKELEQQLAERDKQSADLVAAAKEVGDANERLAARAIAAEKQIVMLRGAVDSWLQTHSNESHDALYEAFISTADLAGLVVCDAVPAAFVVEGDQDGHKDLDFLFSVIDQLPVGTKLYIAKEKA